tara:strand:- start:67 stop:498 length:432 start_codon:yes stop_codon:yes gene_type:complete
MSVVNRLLLILILPMLAFGQGDLQKIKEVLSKQETAWNQGDIHSFMLGYWQSDKLHFSSRDVTTYGWANTYKKYQKNYPTNEKMGKLQFEIIDLKLNSDTTAIVNGKWELIRKSSKSLSGGFVLTFQKFNNDWLIIKDVTTSD